MPQAADHPGRPTWPRRTLSRRDILAGSIGVAFAAVPAGLARHRPDPIADPPVLISHQRGDLPIVLSAPHGGSVRVPGSRDRTRGVTVRDTRTAELAFLCAQRLTDLLRGMPSFIIAQFSRRDLDPNRPPDDAFESPAAERQYDAYHRLLRAAADRARSASPAAILIDIHGQSAEPDAVYRGTRTGLTVRRLLAAHGPDALEGPDSIFGRLSASGYRTIPVRVDSDSIEQETRFNGGHIVASLGSHHPDGIDAIQVEIGSTYRTPDRLMRTAIDLADAIAHHAKAFMLHDAGRAGPG